MNNPREHERLRADIDFINREKIRQVIEGRKEEIFPHGEETDSGDIIAKLPGLMEEAGLSRHSLEEKKAFLSILEEYVPEEKNEKRAAVLKKAILEWGSSQN